MTRTLVLDSGPLGLLFQKPGIKVADECRNWVKKHLARGEHVIVPEIVLYELKRELLRLDLSSSVAALDAFVHALPGRLLQLNSPALDLAAQLWADARKRGTITADRHALDIDVILSAQVLAAKYDPADFVVATSNVSHISLFVPADHWDKL